MPIDARKQAWNKEGFFVRRGLLTAEEVGAVEDEVIARIRADPPEHHPGQITYYSGPNYLIYPETEPSPTAVAPEDRVSKVFNCHAEGLARRLAEHPEIVKTVAALLGPDLDCFQSQFIFKNPGVIGQPWHQDSYYFRFDRQPQIGVWVALSRATLENGCLWVLPGSHTGPIRAHVADRRPAANRGYLEVIDQDFSGRVPSLMEPGDVLFFHSYLLHMSTDNVANERRAAMVYHYGRAGTQAATPDAGQVLSAVNRWIPVRRETTPMDLVENIY